MNNCKIVIVDYGMGNLQSVVHKVKKLSDDVCISSEKEVIMSADKLILPGVGHFAKGIKNMRTLGLIDSLNQKVIVEKTPILGICLGMQLFTESSEEGYVDGLGWLDGKTLKLNIQNISNQLKVPHMGWNTLLIKNQNKLMEGILSDDMFYFVHSFYVKCSNPDNVVATTEYGIPFASVVAKNNIYGTQFHPEKSHDVGINLIKNFINL